MKKRFIDRDIWRQKSFRNMKGWAQLLDIHMYLELADFAGVAELDIGLAEYQINMRNMIPRNMEEIATELAPRWAHIQDCLFVKKHFLDETQGGVIYLSNPSHVQVFIDMMERLKSGANDIISQVLKHNPSTRFQSLSNAEKEVEEQRKAIYATRDQRKIDGFKSRLKSLEKARRCYEVLRISSLPVISSSAEELKQKIDDKPKPMQLDNKPEPKQSDHQETEEDNLPWE
jgi:hypothetical protein